MSDTTISRSAVSGRAGVAMLTLKLRSAQQEAAQAEAVAEAAERMAERALMAAESDTTVEERTRALDAELAAARHTAAALLAAARAEAAKIAAAMAPPIAAAPFTPAIQEVPAIQAVQPPEPEPREPEPLSPAALTPPAPGTAVAVADGAAFDAEAFAIVFATVFAAEFDMQQLAPPPPKPSFWSHLFHLDIVITALVMVFCLVVVVAWMS